ncbi:restriction endonuclease subunit S [Bhargavaea ginsengi]|uniref:restriction endonuclease subunit S n=1 Tax=Bhargavaea ginsengi TaxID=426757 RepID=UPI00203F0F02|nr:restriction endonuclease subunit S [Bhargavaea ginsengi]MCM3089141.1 restriction endonuclease subunit S [Bhargavaea ginsengi]
MKFNNWRESTWGEISELKYGKALKGYKEKTEGIPVFGTNGKIGYTNEAIAQGPGVVIGRKGAYRGVHFSEEDFFVIDTAYFLKITNTSVDIRWAYYELKSKDLNSLDSGSAIPSTKKEDFYALKVSIPPLNIQKKIAEFARKLDEKISINNDVISKLEALSQTIFKRWFFDFEFPDAEGCPYKSSGGKMVESELGEIPRGFRIGTVKDVASLVGSNVKVNEIDKNTPYIGLEHMPRGSIALDTWETSEKVTSGKTSYNEGDILFGKLRPYFKKVGVAPNNGVCSTDILVLNVINKNYYSYLVNTVSQDVFIEYTTATATGTRMPRTGWKQISSYKLAIPNETVADQFNELTMPFYLKIQEIIMENRLLNNLRDTLLPKLLSGAMELPQDSEVTVHEPV